MDVLLRKYGFSFGFCPNYKIRLYWLRAGTSLVTMMMIMVVMAVKMMMVVVVVVVVMMVVIRWPLSHPLHLVDGEGALRRLLLMASAPVDLHIICYHLSFYIIVYNNLLRFKFQIVIIGFASDTTVFVIGLNIVIIISTAWSPECRAGPYQQHLPH